MGSLKTLQEICLHYRIWMKKPHLGEVKGCAQSLKASERQRLIWTQFSLFQIPAAFYYCPSTPRPAPSHRDCMWRGTKLRLEVNCPQLPDCRREQWHWSLWRAWQRRSLCLWFSVLWFLVKFLVGGEGVAAGWRGGKDKTAVERGTRQWAGCQQYQLGRMGTGESPVLVFIQHVPHSSVWSMAGGCCASARKYEHICSSQQHFEVLLIDLPL